MKEKKSRMEIRLSEKDKKTIERYAKKCGVPVSEFVRQCALGFSPRQALPDNFYDLYSRLCDVCNLIDPGFTEETERKLINLITDIRKQLLRPGKDALTGAPQNQGFYGEKEQPRNGELFVAGDKSEGMECDATRQPPASGP